MEKDTIPLTERPPGTAMVVAMVVADPVPYLRIDLLDNRPGHRAPLVARFTTGLSSPLEAAAAFELLVNGTLWSQPHDMKGVSLPHLNKET